jgi:hypothetical protein
MGPISFKCVSLCVDVVAQLVNNFPVFSILKPEGERERERESGRGIVR